MASYKAVDIDNDEHWGIQLTSGDFEGVIVKYNDVSFNEDGEDCICHFNYDILDPGRFSKYKLEASIDFINELGNTLTILLEDSVKHQTAKQHLDKVSK